MENLQSLAANRLYRDAQHRELPFAYEAVDAIFNFPEDWYARAVWFQLVLVPVSAKQYQYLLTWIDATPPRQLELLEYLPNFLEPELVTQLEAGQVVGYRPRWCGEGWVLESAAFLC